MKRYILLTTFLTYGYAYSETYNYTQMKSLEGFDGIFNLTDPQNAAHSVRLDCQSFFHKLDFYDANGLIKVENYITFGECEYLYENFTKCLNTEKIKCVDSENIFSTDCKCE